MGIITLALQSIRTDKVRSFFYFLTFILTTIFIFCFFSITFHPATNIKLGKDDSSLVTIIAVLVILVSMMCVFIANDFYVENKKKDISIILMSGASVYQIGFYLFIQSMLLMLLAIPLGIFIGHSILPLLSIFLKELFVFDTTFSVSQEAYLSTAVIIGLEIFCCTYLNVGYCYRNSVQKLQGSKIDMEVCGVKSPKRSPIFWIVMYVGPLLFMILNEDAMSYVFSTLFGVVGVQGLVKHSIPFYINKLLSKELLEKSSWFVALGYVRYNLQKIFMLVLILLISSILLMVCIIYHMGIPLLSMLTIISYGSVMILMSVTLLSKISMDLQTRKNDYLHLSYVGFMKKDLRRIMNKEMAVFYSIVLSIPLLYGIVIVTKLLISNQISTILAITILLIEILPIVVSYIISMIMYHSLLKR